MKIAVSATGSGLQSPVSPVFGRCTYFAFVDSETMSTETVINPAASAAGGAGIVAAQFVVQQGAGALITGNVGPNAWDVLAAAGTKLYTVSEGTVQQAVEALNAGGLVAAAAPTSGRHGGMGRGQGCSTSGAVNRT